MFTIFRSVRFVGSKIGNEVPISAPPTHTLTGIRRVRDKDGVGGWVFDLSYLA